jgi:hypothetical protein
MEQRHVFTPRRGEKKGTQCVSIGGDEGRPCYPFMSENIRLPLTFPIASQWAPFLSPLTRGEAVLEAS